jgi:hypothetical protein
VFAQGRHAGQPLPNPTYSGVVGANLRVRPGLTMISRSEERGFTFNPFGVVHFNFFLIDFVFHSNGKGYIAFFDWFKYKQKFKNMIER